MQMIRLPGLTTKIGNKIVKDERSVISESFHPLIPFYLGALPQVPSDTCEIKLVNMSSRYEEKSDDLTTDALPSPPRHGSENRQSNLSDDCDTETQFEDVHTNASRAYNRKTKSRGFTKVKRISPPTAYASIININNSSEVHVGAKITYNLLNRSEKNDDKPEIVETSAINTLRSSTNPLTREDLLFIATHMDERWQDIGRALNFSNGQIQQFHLNHNQYGIKEVIYQMLLDWLQTEPNKATVGYLSSILWEQNQRDVVKRWTEKS